MSLLKIISYAEFGEYQKSLKNKGGNEPGEAAVNAIVNEIIAAVRAEGDSAVRRYATRFEKEVPEKFEVPLEAAREAWEKLKSTESELASSLTLAADHIRRFGELQKAQFTSFETEIEPGLFTGQRVIPIDRAAVYVPAGRFPLISSALMCLIPAAVAGVREKILVSPPREGGLPDWRILAAAHLCGAERVFALGGAQAIAALAIGTETVPKVDFIAGPGNKYVATAKRILFGEVGIDFVAGPTDVLIITDVAAAMPGDTMPESSTTIAEAADFAAADMLAQAEHDDDARARLLVPDREMAELVERSLEKRLARLRTAETARSSLEAGSLVVIYKSMEEAIAVSNEIAPEHLELQVSSPEEWIPGLKNYGSLFIGSSAAEVLGDYSAGINHTLPTSTSARFTGGLSVRHFLKTPTTLRCTPGKAYSAALTAAETIARAEGLAAHAESAALRKQNAT